MVDRDERRDQAAKHLALVKGAFSTEIEQSIATAKVYEDGAARDLELPEAPFDETETLVTTDFAPEALKDAVGKTVVVDPGSFLRPGGNYEDGAFGPEQILCSQSDLYPILRGLRQTYYNGNRGYQRGQLFTDRALYLSDIVFMQDENIRKADVVVLAEPNLTHALENYRSERECDQCLEGRIDSFLRIAAANECQTLICGAFGGGRQGFETSQIVGVFEKWIEDHPGSLGRIIFSVPRACADLFRAAFGKDESKSEPDTDADDDADDGEDFRNIELPEGVVLR